MVLPAARGPASPTACQTSLDFAARTGAPRVLTAEGRSRMAADPGVGKSFTSLRFALSRRSRNLEYNSREKLEGPGAPDSATRSDGPQRLRSWARDSAPEPPSPKSFPCTLSLAHSRSFSSLPARGPAQPPPIPWPQTRRRKAGTLPCCLRSSAHSPVSNFIGPGSREAWPEVSSKGVLGRG